MKRFIFIVTIIISLIIIKNLVTSIYSLWSKKDVISQTQKQLQIEKSKYESYVYQLSQVKQQSFVEEQARDKLFMVHRGETQVVLSNQSQTDSSPPKKAVQAKPQAPWQQWLSLFVDIPKE